MQKSTFDFNKRWQDDKSNQRLRNSDKSADVQKAEIENHLKDCALRFERAPQMHTLKLWASDIVDSGYQDWMVRDICQSIPKKFEKYPTLAQIFDLLRPYLPQVSDSQSELDKLTNVCYPHVKAKFLSVGNQEALDKLVAGYKRIIGNNEAHWTNEAVEKCVLMDWLRTYFKADPQGIIDQGKISTHKALEMDKEYFITHLRRYAAENKLPTK